jgi:hypothetical protein
MQLYDAMVQLHQIDFCVATAWGKREVSISKTCSKKGRVFELSRDYKHIVMPSGGLRSISSLNYNDISRFLPDSHFSEDERHCNCSCDKKN